MKPFYSFYCDGFEKQARTLRELQTKIDSLKSAFNLVGDNYVVYCIKNNSIVSERRGIIGENS